MATDAHEAPSQSTSAAIFSSHYTLPQIRAIHRSFHVAVDEKSARLRTQVGASYRDLLGTADSIVRMHSDNNSVQALLGGMGGRCGRAVIAKKISNLGTCAARNDADTDTQELAQIARARLLERCGLVARRTLKGKNHGTVQMSKGDRLLLVSKVYVLSRLLVKSFRDEGVLSSDVSLVVDTAEHSTTTLKRQLLQSISKVLELSADVRGQANSQSSDHVQKALCAYSLATSSGTRDVLRYFLRVRGDAITSKFTDDRQNPVHGSDDVLASIRLYTTTLLDVQALVPHKLADAISQLKKSPLVADDTLLALDGLRLDVCHRWCGDEIQYYTPFIRHDDLAGSQARAMLTSWATKGGEVIVDGLKTTTERMPDFLGLVTLRTAVLQLWIRDGGKAKGFDPSELLNALRAAFNERMLQVIETKVDKLHLVASEVAASLSAGLDALVDRQVDMWANSNTTADPLGADQFLRELVARLYGRDESVSRAVSCFNSWKHVIEGVSQQVDLLSKQRWDNDVDEIEDEDTINARQQLLSKDDPQALRDTLDSALARGFANLDLEMSKLWQASSSGGVNSNSGKMAMYVIRVLRDIRAGMPLLESDAAKEFGLATVPDLHRRLAETVTAAPVDAFRSALRTQKLVIGRALWEGDTPLPVQPSPHAFKLLRDTSQAMAEAGLDLWSLAAVDVAKKQLSTDMCKSWMAGVEKLLAETTQIENPGMNFVPQQHEQEAEDGTPAKSAGKDTIPPNGDDSTSSQTEQERHDLLTQWLFDITFLRLCLESSADGVIEMSALEERVLEASGGLGGNAKQRIMKSAQAYWKKTSLLFGILVA
ncbi:hypothetical protein B0T11DRAFT_278833 [Plectosphaerella cucumerina]|uniref:Conserved oligomeric Golgi complex subunit 1 n=1 Tax=Plectosphaerella cucumerina TaxID=40658 RepID=A0A8K0TDC0_9PEZI|nr:hypothetical protein B0T11DRAFT_278833 [Plectosphaerella cucumerina]